MTNIWLISHLLQTLALSVVPVQAEMLRHKLGIPMQSIPVIHYVLLL